MERCYSLDFDCYLRRARRSLEQKCTVVVRAGASKRRKLFTDEEPHIREIIEIRRATFTVRFRARYAR